MTVRLPDILLSSVWMRSPNLTMHKHSLFLSTLIFMLVLSACSSPGATTADQPAEPIRIVVPPNPNAVPLFVMMAQNPDLNVEILPVPGVPELTAAMQGNQADVAVFFSAAGAQIYNKGALPDLRLWNINVWRALYLAVPEGAVASLDDLSGQKILASFQGGAPDLMMRASMLAAGFSPDADFVLEYLPSAQVMQMMLMGKGAAALLPEPQTSQLIIKADSENIALSPAIDLQAGFGSSKWKEGEAPLGGIFVLQGILDDPVRRATFEQFVAAYDAAIEYIQSDPDQAAEMIAKGYEDTFGSIISAQAVASALKSDRLLFRTQPAGKLRPDLDAFLSAVIGQAPADEFYVK